MVLDAFSRRVVGWAMAEHLRAELVVGALKMALERRRPGEGVVHHSDRGYRYTSLAFGLRCRRTGIGTSMGSTGDCYENALAESFFAALECELIRRGHWRTHTEARLSVFEFIEGFHNAQGRHSALGYLSPADFERRSRPEAVAEP